jgi:hypothetical protein
MAQMAGVSPTGQPGLFRLGAAPSAPLAKIAWPGGEYQLTLDDVLWMARMARCEGGSAPAASLWTLTQRFVAAGGDGTLGGLARAFSQCINPRWADGGDLCAANPSRCTEAQRARRAAAASIPWEQLPAGIQRTALLWATASLPNPVPRATNFAAPAEGASCIARGSCARVVLEAGNWYLSTAASERWAADHVTMRLDNRVAGPAGPSALSLVIGALFGAAAIYTYTRVGRGGRLSELAYPTQPCGLTYDDFRSGWKYGDAYEHIAFRPESKGTSQRAVLRAMRELKQAEYERYLDDCEHAAGGVPDFDVDPADYQD